MPPPSTRDLVLAMHAAENRLRSIREALREQTRISTRARTAEVIEALDDTLDALSHATGAQRFARIVTAPHAVAVIGRHVVDVRRVALAMCAGTPVQRASIVRIADDVADDAHRLCVAVCDAHGVLRTVEPATEPIAYAPGVQGGR